MRKKGEKEEEEKEVDVEDGYNCTPRFVSRMSGHLKNAMLKKVSLGVKKNQKLHLPRDLPGRSPSHC